MRVERRPGGWPRVCRGASRSPTLFDSIEELDPASTRAQVRFRSETDIDRQAKSVGSVANDPKRTFNTLFDHLVGGSQQRLRDRYVKYPCGLSIYDQLELGGLDNGQIGGLRAI